MRRCDVCGAPGQPSRCRFCRTEQAPADDPWITKAAFALRPEIYFDGRQGAITHLGQQINQGTLSPQNARTILFDGRGRLIV